jgi:hypothetical protein
MLKRWVFVFLLFAATGISATEQEQRPEVRLPLYFMTYAEYGYSFPRLMSRFNPELRSAGNSTVYPDTITYFDGTSTDPGRYVLSRYVEYTQGVLNPLQDWQGRSRVYLAYIHFSELEALIASEEKLGNKNQLFCYSGSPAEVVKILQGLVDSPLGENVAIQAYRFNNVPIYVKHTENELKELGLVLPTKWRLGGTGGASILLLVSDSTPYRSMDLSTVTLPKCR